MLEEANKVDPWIEKALWIRHETECLSTITIRKAALLLENNHREAPYYKTAATLSLKLPRASHEKERTGGSAQPLNF